MNGDGDDQDQLVMSYYIPTGAIAILTDGRSPSISGSKLAYEVDEYRINLDLNGDGDMQDYILRHYNLNTGTIGEISEPGFYPSIQGNIIGYNIYEHYLNYTDVNGNGQYYDSIMRLYDLSDGTLNGYVETGYAAALA